MWAAATANPHHTTTTTPPKFLGESVLMGHRCELPTHIIHDHTRPDTVSGERERGYVSCDLLKGPYKHLDRQIFFSSFFRFSHS